jgi:hypothetical protein
MKNALLGLCAAGLMIGAIAWSNTGTTPRPDFDFKTEAVNPVTKAKLNNNPNDFQFVVVSDRTGGQRARIFSQAVEQINLMQPEFVLSVGDLINGYTRDKEKLANEWKEFQTYVSRLKMPFFYVPGNHDITNDVMADIWKDKFGRTYYEFVYRDVLFLCLNSEDPPGKGYSNISPEQIAWVKGILEKHKDVRWTIVALHKPMWIQNDVDKNGWGEVEKLLNGRNYTVFAGHVHRYQKFVRQGMNYYMFATTGGVSKLRGTDYGEFDHIVWVTMKNDGPVIANLLLDGIYREDLSPIITDEEGLPQYMRRPTIPVEATVTLDGQPLAGADVVFTGTGTERGQARADGRTDDKGKVRLSTYKAFDGVPAGEYGITITLRRPLFTPEGKPGPNTLPEKYASLVKSGLKAEISGSTKQTIEINLSSEGEKE